VHVEVLGTSDRSGDTNSTGQLSLTAMQAGTYRLRFSGDEVVTFEREVILRAGQIANLDIALNIAPPPPAPPPPPRRQNPLHPRRRLSARLANRVRCPSWR
jgi:hypothetical protein